MIDAPPLESAYVRQVPVLTEAGALALAAAAVEAARREGLAIAVSVVDAGGHLLVFRRMDGAPSVTVEVATGKARTAVALGAPSQIFEKMINAGETAMVTTPGVLPLQGGTPVVSGGKIAGGVGVSGAKGEQDSQLAEQAVAIFGKEKQE